jgi:hypothetical protein
MGYALFAITGIAIVAAAALLWTHVAAQLLQVIR